MYGPLKYLSILFADVQHVFLFQSYRFREDFWIANVSCAVRDPHFSIALYRNLERLLAFGIGDWD
jgi:hypothetical protein